MTTPFPRGGKQELTPLELREVHEQAKRDVLNEEKVSKKRKAEPITPTAKKVKQQSYTLSYKRLSTGMSLLGVIKQINELDMEIQLPNQLVGYCSITEISDELTRLVELAADDDSEDEVPDLNDYFSVGQVVVVGIVSLENKRVDVTVHPSKLNKNTIAGMHIPAQVTSIEDHGYLLNFGSKNDGFLLRKDCSVELKVGQVVNVNVTLVEKVIKCTMSRDSCIPSSSNISLEQLVAGNMIHTKVVRVELNGVHVSFLGVLEGFLPLLHLNLGTNFDLSGFKKGQKIQCRILYVDAVSKTIGLTKRPQFIKWESSVVPEDYPVGTIVEECEIITVDSKLGVHVKIDDVVGYVHISKLADNRVENVEKTFKVGSKQKGRIIGYDACDNVLLLSFEQRILNQQFMSLKDIEVGSEVRGTVKRIESFGVIVAVTDVINGLCPSLHLSDVQMSHPEKLFKIGSKMTFRVLSVDEAQKRLILTHKKSLMGMKYDPFTSYDLKSEQISMGVITAVKDFGCIVTFFNEVRALAPVSELGHDSPQVGKAVKCQVLTVDPTNQKLRVTFRITQPSQVVVGSVGEAMYVSTTDTGIIASVDDKQITIPINHLSDFIGQSKKLHRAFAALTSKKRFSIGKCVVTHVDKKGISFGSLKKVLVESAEKNAVFENVSDLKEGQVVPAVVSNLTDNMCFVLIGKITAVANIHHIMDGFLSVMTDYLEIGQTVLVSILKLEPETNRVYVTLKNSQLLPPTLVSQIEVDCLNSLFQSRGLEFAIGSRDAKWMEKFVIGNSITGVVDQIMPVGIAVSLAPKVSGLLPPNTTLKKGDKVNCQILDIDISSRIVDLRLLPDENRISTDTSEVEKAMKENTKVEGFVVLVKEDYAVIRMKCCEAIGYILNRPVNSAKAQINRYKIGQSVSVHIKKQVQYENGVNRILLEPMQIAVKKVADTRRLLKNPVDKSFATLDDFKLGATIIGKIQSVKGTQLNIRLADNLRGRVHVTEVFDSIDHITDPKTPLKTFKNGQEITCVVIGFHDVKTHKHLAFSHTNPIGQTGIELSIRPSVLKNGYSGNGIDFGSLEIGKEYVAFIHRVEQFALWAQLGTSLLGRIDALNVSLNPEICSDLEHNFKEGEAIKVKVLSKDDEKHAADLTITDMQNETITTGDIRLVRITKKDSAKGLNVYLRQGVYGRISVSEINDDFTKDPTSEFKVNDVVKAIVVSTEDGRTDLSLRRSRFSGKQVSVSVGDVVKGYVTAISANGCYLSLGWNQTARVKIALLSDSYVKEWKKLYSIGQLVPAKVLSINEEKGQMECSLKESDIDPSKKRLTFEDLKAKSVVSGVVKRIETFGVFVQIDGSDIRGLCHISELSDDPVKEISKVFEVEDKVQAYILKVDRQKKQVSLSLKASRFEEDAMEVDDQSDEDTMSVSDDEVVGSNLDDSDDDDDDENEESEMEIEPKEEAEAEPEELNEQPVIKFPIKQPLILEGFSWDSNDLVNPVVDSSDSDEGSDVEQEKKSRRTAKKEKADKEKMIQEREMQLLDTNRTPEMPEDFERMLLGSPNNSFIWIKYMAFQLGLAETKKTRKIADRALSTINFREEQERLNILVAYLNLENKFGTPETLQKVFEKACSLSDPKKVHLQLVKIFERHEQDEQAVELHKKMCKKFNMSCKIWLGFALYTLKKGDSEKAREIITRSMKSLPQRKHTKILTKFGQSEFKMGSPERGRTIFEGLVSAYPKRIDLWNIYLDMEIRVCDVDICRYYTLTRRLFERVLNQKWSTKKMQFLFKKYSQFEKSHGTPEGVNHVVQSAKRYLESLH